MRKLFKRHLFCHIIALLLFTITLIGHSSIVEASESIDTNRYFYNQLTDLQKEVYDAFYNLPDDKITITISASKFPAGTDLTSATILVSPAYIALCEDNPDYCLYWAKGTIGGSYDETTNSYIFNRQKAFTNEYTLKKSQDTMNRWIQAVGTDTDYYTRIRRIYDIMANNIEYDWNYPYLYNRGLQYNDNSIGATVYGLSVCGGYCSTFKTLCDAVGIPCIQVGNSSHAWNYVQMEDGKWYAIDTTNCIPEGYTNILLGMNDENYYNNYGCNELYLGSPEFGFTFPELSEDNYIYTGSTTDFSYTISKSTFKKEEGRFIYTENEDGTWKIADYYGEASGTLIIPEEYKGKPVTVIGESAFYFCTGFTGTLEIPSTITTIEPLAFGRCTGLSGELTLPNSLMNLGESAFVGCINLNKKVSIPSCCTIGNNALNFNYNNSTLIEKRPAQTMSKGTITIIDSDITYNGKQQTPSIKVKDADGNIIFDRFYTVTYSNNKNVGKGTIKVTFKDNYTGTLKKTFTIKPPTTKLSKVSGGSKSISVKWKKQKKQVTGYEIQYSTNKKFKSPKKVTIKKNTKTSTNITKLKKNKKYFVRIRTYKTVKVNGKKTKIYSNWSNTKTIKTKK